MHENITIKNSAINLNDLGLLCASGKDIKRFLQGQLTCDLEEINANQSQLGAHCDGKGRIIANFRLFLFQNDYYFLLQRSTLPLLLTSLKKYAIFSKVTLKDVSEDWQVTGFYEATAKNLFTKQKLIQENNVAVSDHTLSLSIPGLVPRVILLSPINESNLNKNKFEQQSVNYWHLLDVMAGIPTVYPEISGQFTPHQLNFPEIGGVSFNKGCYIGQEIIARTHYLGKSKSRLYRVAFLTNSTPVPGTPLFDSDQRLEKGTLIMCAKEQDSRYEALVCLQTQAVSHTIRLGSLEGPLIDFLEIPYSINN